MEPLFGEAGDCRRSGPALPAGAHQPERHAGGGCRAGLHVQLSDGRTAFRPRPAGAGRQGLGADSGHAKGPALRRGRVLSHDDEGASRAGPHMAGVERTRSLRGPALGVHRRLGLDGEHPLRPSGGRGAGLQPAQARPGQPSPAFVRGGGHASGSPHGMAPGRHGQRHPLGRGDGAGLEPSRRAGAFATEPGRHRLRPGKDHSLARDGRRAAPVLSVQAETYRQRAPGRRQSAVAEVGRTAPRRSGTIRRDAGEAGWLELRTPGDRHPHPQARQPIAPGRILGRRRGGILRLRDQLGAATSQARADRADVSQTSRRGKRLRRTQKPVGL